MTENETPPSGSSRPPRRPEAPPRPRFTARAEDEEALAAAQELQEQLSVFRDEGSAAAPEGGAPRKRRGITSAVAAFGAAFGSKGADADIDEDEDRWLLRIQSIDYGPYAAAGVRERLEKDEIDEHTLVTDTVTGDMSELVDVPFFTDFVLDYIPQRERRKLEAAERREELIHEVKKRSVRATFSVAIGAVLLSAFGLTLLHVTNLLRFGDVLETLSPRPVEFPFEQVVRNYRYRFVVPEPDYQAIQADSALIASLFRGDSSSSSSGRRSSSRDSQIDDLGPDDEEYVMDFAGDSGPSFRLSSQEISGTLSANSGAIQSCFASELRNNPSFRGVNLRFSIRPDGRTFNVRISSSGEMSGTVETCLVRAVRRIQFPRFNDLPMSVSFPFYVQ